MTNTATAKKDQPIFRAKYETQIRKDLTAKHGYKNPFEIPKVTKIVLNMGIGKATENRAFIEKGVDALTVIAGQKAVVTRARSSNASFKTREGMALGAKVTLRGERMYEFLDRLINIAMPRIRDFRGISANSFDGRGNYALGIREHFVFPEVSIEKVDQVQGLDIVVCTSAKNDDEARDLLRAFGFPFRGTGK